MNTEPIDWNKWKARCSSISKIMANSKGNEPLTPKQEEEVEKLRGKLESGKITDLQKLELVRLLQKEEDSKTFVISDTAASYLLEAYAWETQRMVSITKELDVEAFERGRKTEPESIKLLCSVDKVDYYKNETRFENDFLTGIPDLITIDKNYLGHGDYSEYCSRIRELKSTRDYPTFLYKIHKGLDPGNKEQTQGYGDILDCKDLAVVFTLPNMPEEIRLKYKYKLADRLGEATTESPRFLKTWAEIEHSMVFDSIPDHKRTFKVPVEPFARSEQQAVYERVKHAREWLNNFHLTYLKMNQ
jgi:hypothetical protein